MYRYYIIPYHNEGILIHLKTFITEQPYKPGTLVKLLPNIVEERTKLLPCNMPESRNQALLSAVGQTAKIVEREIIDDIKFYRITGILLTEENHTYDIHELLIPKESIEIINN